MAENTLRISRYCLEMKMNKVAYIASPYSHELPRMEQERHDRVADYVGFLHRHANVIPISPIVCSHYLARSQRLPTDAAYWREINHWLIDKCDIMIVLKLDGWQKSAGVQDEIEYAESQGKPVFYQSKCNTLWFTEF